MDNMAVIVWHLTQPSTLKILNYCVFQVSGKPFTLETLDRKAVPFDEEIRESCVWLRCVPALDRCRHWTWRVRDGKLELREWDSVIRWLHLFSLQETCGPHGVFRYSWTSWCVQELVEVLIAARMGKCLSHFKDVCKVSLSWKYIVRFLTTLIWRVLF